MEGSCNGEGSHDAHFFPVGYIEERLWWPIQIPQQRKKEESEKLRGERDRIKFIDLRFERWQFVRFRKVRRRQEAPQIACYWGER